MSRDGGYIASLGKDSFVKVWDLKCGRQMVTSMEIPGSRLVRFIQTHELVLIGCKDNRLFIWDWRKAEITYR